jgi:DtxR family transcriptional regulator, iron-dependent repressor
MTTPTTEAYLEIIYMMASEGQTVKGARLAESLQVSRPTVTATLRRIARDGLIKLNHKKEIELTKKGFKVADNLQRRHRIVERWLTDGLGFDWAKSDAEAHRLEHVISDEVIERLNEVLGRPPTCPHGNAIPGNERSEAPRQVFPLGQAQSGDRVEVVRISEYAENTGRLLCDLGERGLRPGAKVTVADVEPLHGTLTLKVENRYFSLAHQIAECVWVAKSR